MRQMGVEQRRAAIYHGLVSLVATNKYSYSGLFLLFLSTRTVSMSWFSTLRLESNYFPPNRHCVCTRHSLAFHCTKQNFCGISMQSSRGLHSMPPPCERQMPIYPSNACRYAGRRSVKSKCKLSSSLLREPVDFVSRKHF